MNEIASRYAFALYSIALEKKDVITYENEVKQVLELLDENKDFLPLLKNEFLSIKQRQQICHEVFKGFNDDIVHLVDIVIQNHRVNFLLDIFQAYITDANAYQGVKEGLLYSSIKLDKETIGKIEGAVSKKEGCGVYLKLIVDQTLIGGMRVMINDHVYDASIISQIEKIKSKLLRNEG